MVELCKKIAESAWFQNFITFVIVLAGVVVGFETYPDIRAEHEAALHVLDQVILYIFVAEIAIKMIAESPRFWNYYRDPWNDFDFVIVVAAFLPFAAQYATVLRLLRLLRVLRLVRALPKLQLLVGALLKSIPSMGYVSVLLLMLFYVYACAGVFMWGENDPDRFGSLEIAFVTLFRVVTLEDWTDVMYTAMYGCGPFPVDGLQTAQCDASQASMLGGALYFISFVLFGTMIVMNLIIGVIIGGMDEARRENDERDAMERRKARGETEPGILDEINTLTKSIDEMQDRLSRVRKLAAARSIPPPGS